MNKQRYNASFMVAHYLRAMDMLVEGYSFNLAFIKHHNMNGLQNRWVKWINSKHSSNITQSLSKKINYSISCTFLFMITDGYDNYGKMNELSVKHLLSKLTIMNWKKHILSEIAQNHLNTLYFGNRIWFTWCGYVFLNY